MVKNKYIEALIKFILFSAILHIILLVIYSIFKGKLIYLNYFKVLDLDLFFPGITNGLASQAFSFLILVLVYSVIYFRFTKTEKL